MAGIYNEKNSVNDKHFSVVQATMNQYYYTNQIMYIIYTRN